MILNCPCCGGGVSAIQCPIKPQDGGDIEMKFWLRCTKCPIQTYPAAFNESPAIIAAWNKRYVTPVVPPTGPINHTDSAVDAPHLEPEK